MVSDLRASLSAVVLIALTAMPAAGCGGEDCNDIGCSSGVTARLGTLAERKPDTRSVTLCVDRRCGKLVDLRPQDPGETSLGVGLDGDGSDAEEGDEVEVRYVARNREGRIVASDQTTADLVDIAPKDACDTCAGLGLDLDQRLRLVVSSEAAIAFPDVDLGG